MITEHRAKSMITGCDMEELFTLKGFPIWMMAGEEETKDCFVDFKLEIGKEDGFVQVADIIPPEILYKDSHFDTPSKVWRDMYDVVADKIRDYTHGNNRLLEIGGGAGRLNAAFNRLGGGKSRSGISWSRCHALLKVVQPVISRVSSQMH